MLTLLAAMSAQGVELRSSCPPGFEHTEQNQCVLRSRYDEFASVRGRGVGGTRTGLPHLRAGFTPQQIDLGRYLFFDPILSVDQSVSCASCHQPEMGFADGRPRAQDRHGDSLSRSAPSLWNVGFLQRLFWDGRSSSLEAQLAGPLYAEVEMGNTPENLRRDLNAIPEYRNLFAQAFPQATTGIELEQVYTALAAFESSLVSLNSRYDQYALGYQAALSDDEIAGLNVFRSFVARCAECHTPPLFTNGEIAVIGTPEPAGIPFDRGAGASQNEPLLEGGFKVPTLRNIALTAPYMHSGRYDTLAEAVAFYNGGRGHAAPDDRALTIHWHIHEPNLREHEIALVVAFLGTLTDQQFMPEVPSHLPSGLNPLSYRQF